MFEVGDKYIVEGTRRVYKILSVRNDEIRYEEYDERMPKKTLNVRSKEYLLQLISEGKIKKV